MYGTNCYEASFAKPKKNIFEKSLAEETNIKKLCCKACGNNIANNVGSKMEKNLRLPPKHV